MNFKFLKINRNKTCDVGSAFKSAEKIILQWGGSTVPEEAKKQMNFSGDRFRIDQYLEAVDEIQQRKECARTSDDQSKADRPGQIAMARLADEFRIILNEISPLGSNSRTNLQDSTSITDSTSTLYYEDYDYYSEYSTKNKETVSDLRSIAVRMNSAGHLPECVKVYKDVRKSFIDASFGRLGIQKLSVAEVPRLEWKVLEEQIGQWMLAAYISVRILFVHEKRLCEQIFESLGTATTDACFMQIVKDNAIRLFSFAEAISISRRSPERLFTILYLHDSLFDLLPVVDAVFQSESSRPVFLLAARILAQLAEAARGILLTFEKDVLHENSNFQDHGGRILPLTGYVMSYIIEISYNKESLTKLVVSLPKLVVSLRSKDENRSYSNDLTIPDIEFSELDGRTPLDIHLIWIIHLLQIKLRSKSKHYHDASLAQLFIITNFDYIFKTVHTSQVLQNMIGDQYVEKLIENVRQAIIAYRTSTWDRVFHCLTDDGLDVSKKNSSGVSKCSLGKRLKTFNAMLEEVYSSQATWLVEDLQLGKQLQVSILEELIPNYKSFLGTIEDLRGSGRDGEISVKYSVEDLETAISNLFDRRPHSIPYQSNPILKLKGHASPYKSNPTVKFEAHPIRHRSNPIVHCWKCF